MEFVEGRPLSRLIDEGPLKLGRALEIAVQAASALEAAHRAGIVHRDLKPANIMVGGDGRVKVLDFGVAKLMNRREATEDETTQTMEPATEEGRIVGTVAYMSPEQAEGKPVDARSDIFTFGSVLYEMLTGRRAFPGDSKISTLAAILKENPRPVTEIVENLPEGVERVISRCLRKDPADRFQQMDEVRIALEDLKQQTDSGAIRPAVLAQRRRWAVWLGAAAVPLIVAGAAVSYLRSNSGREEPSLVAVPLTSYPGAENYPSLSPDGSQVAFSWCRGALGSHCNIYVKQIGVEPPSQLTTIAANEHSPAWSPDGQTIAFVREFSPQGRGFSVIVIPQRGGPERIVAEVDAAKTGDLPAAPLLTWTPDSQWLVCPLPHSESKGRQAWALCLVSVATGEQRKLTRPPDEGGLWVDTAPSLSPDGRTLVFARGPEGTGRWDLYLLRLREGYEPSGEPERISSKNRINFTASWTPDGRDIIFASCCPAEFALWRMPASRGASPRKLGLAGGGPSISRKGDRLAFVRGKYDTDIWRVDVRGPGFEPGQPLPLIASTQQDLLPAYSPDGGRIAFVSGRSGPGPSEVWTCDSDGSHPVQLTSFGGLHVASPRWSPDGKMIAFWVRHNPNLFYVISANGGVPRRLGEGTWPTWSPDGQSLYYISPDKGIWKISVAGGSSSRTVASELDTDSPQISADGKFLYYGDGWHGSQPQSVWRVPIEGGKHEKILDEVNPQHWAICQKGIYFFTKRDKDGRSTLSIYEFATAKSKKILTDDRLLSTGSIGVSPDGRTILYTREVETGTDLMLVENFR